MKRATAASLLLLSGFACDRVCGDLQPLSTGGSAGSAGIAGAGGMSAGGAGSSALGGAAGAEAGGAAGIEDSAGLGGLGGGDSTAGEAGASAGVPGAGASACAPAPVPDANGLWSIIDFDDGLPRNDRAEMRSEGAMESVEDGAYRVNRDVVADNEGFSLEFLPCVDASASYVGVAFQLEGSTAGHPLEFSLVTLDDAPSAVVALDPNQQVPERCLRFADLTESRDILELRFRFEPPSMGTNYTVNVSVDDFAFVTSCP